MQGVILTGLKKISNEKGDIFHALKRSDKTYEDFGEVYFSWIKKDHVKGWKKHKEMTLNLIVPVGDVKFIIFNNQSSAIQSFEIIIGESNYSRLSIMPGLYFAFQGLKQSNLVMNVASVEHDDKESENLPLDYFDYDWSA